jgi:hypothetical protein
VVVCKKEEKKESMYNQSEIEKLRQMYRQNSPKTQKNIYNKNIYNPNNIEIQRNTYNPNIIETQKGITKEQSNQEKIDSKTDTYLTIIIVIITLFLLSFCGALGITNLNKKFSDVHNCLQEC